MRLTDDQRFTLEGLLRVAKEEKADAIVVAGDVFDRAAPPVDAVDLLDFVLRESALKLKIPVVMIAGNHDNPVRLQYLSGLIGQVGVHAVGEVCCEPESTSLVGSDGTRVVFWPLAYTDPETARCVMRCDDIHCHEEALCRQIESIKERMEATARHVIVGHAFVTGSLTCESERPLTVGGTGSVSHTIFDGFDYVALGHLHRPQSVSERVRYAGSLLKYSFDEAEHRKSVTVVDLGKTGPVKTKEVELPIRRDLVRLSGSFDELLNHPEASKNAAAYVEVTLTDGEAVLDPMERLRAVYPNILSLRREGYSTDTEGQARAPARGRSTSELFTDFFADATGEAMSEAQELEVADSLEVLSREMREIEQ